jgi:hypothetical protein
LGLKLNPQFSDFFAFIRVPLKVLLSLFGSGFQGVVDKDLKSMGRG